MSEKVWNPEQQKAISSFGGNILVSAAAGSGKTAVLVERVIRMLTDPEKPVDADRLLIVTFTRLAAAEMKARISSSLSALSLKNPNDRNLSRQILLMERAHIGTIHSFCTEVVKENAAALGLPPSPEIADEDDGKDLFAAALEETVEQYYKAGTPDFLDLCETLGGGRNDTGLNEAVTSLYHFITSMPHYEQWLFEKLSMYSPDIPLGESLWGKRIFEDAEVLLNYHIERANRLKKACDEELITKLSEVIIDDISQLESLLFALKTGRWNSFAAAIYNVKFKKKPMKCGESPLLAEQFKRIRDSYKDAVNKTLKKDFSVSEEDYLEDIKDLYPKIKCLFALTLDFSKRFSEVKREKGIIDFTDLEQFSLSVLTEKNEKGEYIPSKTARDISERFDYILVDECQDTNKVQETILTTVSKGNNMFFVGDVKQSIYRFRNAMPQLFLDKRESWPLLTDEENYPATIILGRNYRSRKNIAGAVNYIFGQIMSKEAAEIEYNEEEMLIPAASYPEDGESPRNELMLIESKGDSAKTEAAAVAEKIEQMLLDKVRIFDRELGQNRDITPGDICILFRATKNKTEIFLSALRQRGISCKSEKDKGFLSRPEIAAVLDVLKAVDNPLLDIPLAGAMLSEMFLFTPDELCEIRAETKKEPFYLSVKRAAENGNTKAADFIKTLDTLRKAAAYERSDTLIERLYDMTAFPQIMLSCPDGDLRLGNLRLLVKYAADREKLGAKGLSSFMRFIARLEAREGDLAAAGNSGSGNSVRVISVHGSKGLEFPVVFLCGTGKQFKFEKSDETMLHPNLGFACPRRDKETGARFETLPQLALKKELRRYNLAEEMRILYVALTRPKENLIITYCDKNILDKAGKICAGIEEGEKIDPFTVQNAKNEAEWLLSSLLRHPNALNIRTKAGIGEEIVLPDETNWAFSYVDEISEKAKEEASEETKAKPDMEIYETLKARSAWRYPFEGSVNIPTKAGVSSLTHKEMHEKMLFTAKPTGTALSGAERGTALHTFMQFCDFEKAKADPKAEIRRLAENKFITEKQGKVISPEKITAFFESELYRRIENSPKVYRELRFLRALPAKELGYENADPEDKITVQGVADCVFEENGKLIVVDYKTDFVEDVEELRSRYAAQLYMYKRLLTDSLGKEVTEAVIWSFRFGKELEV